MKYIDSEKLIAEIKGIIAAVKVKKHPDEFGSIEQCLAAAEIEALNIALDCIKELQPKQPDNEDIDKVAQELYEHLYELKRRNNVPTNLYDKQEIIALWKAGIEYAYNHPKQDQPEVDLEKAAEQYSQNILAGGEDMFDAIADGFIAGAKWIEEQMKNTVDGHCFVSPVDSSVLFVQTDHFENKKGFRHGETCKVIVLKSL